jgi:ankyrin repeat protein
MKFSLKKGLAYLGEYPLAWAACTANETIYNLLLDKGADPDAQDSFGNTVLHMVVVTNQMVNNQTCLSVCLSVPILVQSYLELKKQFNNYQNQTQMITSVANQSTNNQYNFLNVLSPKIEE